MTNASTNLLDTVFANVYAAHRGTHVPGYTPNPAATADDFQVGQVVAIFSRGNERLAVIEKIGKKNVTVAYVSEGGVSDGHKAHARILSYDAKAIADSVAAQAGKNYDYHVKVAAGQHERHSDPKWADYFTPERKAADIAEAQAWLDAAGSKADYVAAQWDKEFARTNETVAFAQAHDYRAYVNVTRKTVKFGEVAVKN